MQLRIAIVLATVFLALGCSFQARELEVARPPTGEVARGALLVRGVAHCGYCHGAAPSPTAPLVGGQLVYDRYGSLAAPNLTPARSGLADWDASDIVRAIRASTTPSERALSPDVHRGYEWMSDADAYAIAAYLQSLAAVENQVPRRELSTFTKYTTGLFEGRRAVRSFVPSLEPQHGALYGEYLVDHVARCGSCHNTPATIFSSGRYLEGGGVVRVGDDERIAPNITNSRSRGIGDWHEQQIVRYLEQGVTASGEQIDSRFCPTNFYRLAPREALQAIAQYLTTVGS